MSTFQQKYNLPYFFLSVFTVAYIMDKSYLSKILWIGNFLVFWTMLYIVLHSVDILLILFWFNGCDQVRFYTQSGEWSVKKSNAVYIHTSGPQLNTTLVELKDVLNLIKSWSPVSFKNYLKYTLILIFMLCTGFMQCTANPDFGAYLEYLEWFVVF